MNKLKIELGGKERTLRFNLLFAKELSKLGEAAKKSKEQAQDDDNKDVDEVMQNLSWTGMFIYAGLKADSQLTGVPMDLDSADCYDLAEELIVNNEVDKIRQIHEAYTASTAYTFLEDVKKKMETETSQPIGMQLEDTLSVN